MENRISTIRKVVNVDAEKIAIKELKDKTGENLFNLFETEWENAELIHKNNLVKNITAIKKQDLTPENYKQKIMDETNKYFDEIANQIKNNSKIQDAFSGENKLLQKNIDFKKSVLSNLLLNFEHGIRVGVSSGEYTDKSRKRG